MPEGERSSMVLMIVIVAIMVVMLVGCYWWVKKTDTAPGPKFHVSRLGEVPCPATFQKQST